MVLVGMAMAIGGWWFVQRRALAGEHDAKKAIEVLGGIAMLDSSGIHVATLNLQLVKDPSAIKQAMSRVGNFGRLQVLDLSNTSVSDEDLATVRSMRELKSLHLNDTSITNAGLEHLASLTDLEGLHIAGTRVDAKGLASVGRLIGLRQLDVSRIPIADGLTSLDPLDSLVWLVAKDGVWKASHAEALARLDGLKRVTLGSGQSESEFARALLAVRPELTID